MAFPGSCRNLLYATGTVLTAVLGIHETSVAAIVSHESYGAFSAAAPSNLIREDWSSVPLGVIENQIINGVHYTHTDAFGHQLAIGNGGVLYNEKLNSSFIQRSPCGKVEYLSECKSHCI